MKFTVEITEEAIGDLKYFDKTVQVAILDTIEQQLGSQPLQETRNRKPLRSDSQFNWELKIGKHRVFYDVIEESVIVSVISIGYKEHNKLYIRGQEVNL